MNLETIEAISRNITPESCIRLIGRHIIEKEASIKDCISALCQAIPEVDMEDKIIVADYNEHRLKNPMIVEMLTKIALFAGLARDNYYVIQLFQRNEILINVPEDQKKQLRDYLAEINSAFKICELNMMDQELYGKFLESECARTINKPVSVFFDSSISYKI